MSDAMQSLPALSETRLSETDTLMCDECGISAPVATGIEGGRHHCGGTFRRFVRDESLAAATARLSLFCAWGDKIDGTPRRKYTDGGGVYFIRRDIDALIAALASAREETARFRKALAGDDPEMPEGLWPIETIAAAVDYAEDEHAWKAEHSTVRADEDPDATWECIRDAIAVVRELRSIVRSRSLPGEKADA